MSEESNFVTSSEDDGESDVAQMTNFNASKEINKGNDIKVQKRFWDKICEYRIKMQKLLVSANRLPQQGISQVFIDKGGDDYVINQAKCLASINELFHNLIKLKNSYTLHSGNEDSHKNDPIDITNFEEKSEKNSNLKRTLERYEDILDSENKKAKCYRNSIIDFWDEKTRLSSGKMTQKFLVEFDNSSVKQIEQVLQDKNRLIKRTQIKRTLYDVIGKTNSMPIKEQDDEINENSKQNENFDSEIFDDDDYYRHFLKDVINSKSDFEPLRKAQHRNKAKCIDTKATKGRKLRYDVQPKLRNYMAPLHQEGISDDARNQLLKCLFNKDYK